MKRVKRFILVTAAVLGILSLGGCGAKEQVSIASEDKIPVQISVEESTLEDDGVYIGSIRKLTGEFDEIRANFVFAKDGILYFTQDEIDKEEGRNHSILLPINPATGELEGEPLKLGEWADVLYISSAVTLADDYIFLAYEFQGDDSEIILTRCSKDGTVITQRPLKGMSQIPVEDPSIVRIVSDDGNLYLITDGVVTLLDNELGFKKVLLNAGYNSGCVGPDGLIYFVDFLSGNMSSYDAGSDKVKENILNIPSASEVYAGAEGELLVSTGHSLKSVDLKSLEVTALFDYIDVGLSNVAESTIYRDDAGDIHICFSKKSEVAVGGQSVSVLVPFVDDIRRYSKENAPQADEIRIACLYMNSDLREVINDYKLAHPEIRINIKSYDEKHGNFNEVLEAIDADIINGAAYDVWVLDGIPIRKYSEKGLFENLLPYIQSDSSFDISKYYENGLMALKEGDKLYALTSKVYLESYVADKDVFGNKEALSFDDIVSARERYKDIPFIATGYCDSVFTRFLRTDYTMFLGGREGVYDFETEEFERLLAFAGTFPSWTEEQQRSYNAYAEIMEGNAKFRFASHTGVLNFLLDRGAFGNKARFYKIESSSGSHFYISPSGCFAISTMSTHKEEAWELLKGFLDAKDYSSGLEYRVNRDAFKTGIHDSWAYSKEDSAFTYRGLKIPTYMTEADGNIIIDMMEQAIATPELDAKIWDIIEEEVSYYFVGEKTLEETVKILQKRVNLYLEESR
ncbi:MAG: hypothetical protein IK018_13150 [Lachnospiraceae bacterium]|nr:hypothetical protein [Lachnospiraceae bacterium]